MDGGIKQTIATPLSDADIREYLPNANIIKYSELSKYPTLNDLLPEEKSFCILLYEESPNSGHWTVVSKPAHDTVEYFDSYGGYVDAPLNWTPESNRVGLGQATPYLSNLFNRCKENVVYNKVKYQKEGQHINDCGRWCVLRTLKMMKGLDLDEFHKYVKEEDKKYVGDKDAFVAQIIP